MHITILVGAVRVTLERETDAEGGEGYLGEVTPSVLVAATQTARGWRVAVVVVDEGAVHLARAIGHAQRSSVEAAAGALPAVAVEVVELGALRAPRVPDAAAIERAAVALVAREERSSLGTVPCRALAEVSR